MKQNQAKEPDLKLAKKFFGKSLNISLYWLELAMALLFTIFSFLTQLWTVHGVFGQSNLVKILFPVLFVDFGQKTLAFSNDFQPIFLNHLLGLKTLFSATMVLSFLTGWFLHQLQIIQKLNKLSQPAVSLPLTDNNSVYSILLKADKNYQNLAEILPEAVFVFVNKKCVYINPAGVQLLGAATPENILGKSILELGFSEDESSAMPLSQTLMRQDHQLISVEVTTLPFTYFKLPALQLIVTPKPDLTSYPKIPEQEEILINLLKNLSLPVAISRVSDGFILEANQQFLDLFNIPSGTLNKYQSLDFYQNPKDRQIILNKIVKEGGLSNYELQVKKTDQTLLWISVSLQPLIFKHENALLCIILDMTECKQTHSKLLKSEEQLQALLNAIPDLIFRYRLDGTSFSFLSKHCSSNFFLSLNSQKFDLETILISKEAKTALPFLFKKAIHTGQLQTYEHKIELEKKIYQFETRIIKSGEDEVVCIVRDITERKQIENTLNEQEEHYRRLVELSPDGIFVVQNGILNFVNSAFVLMLGASSPHDLLGKPMINFIHPDFHQEFLKRHQLAHQLELQTHLFYEKMIRIDGTEIDVEVAETWTEINGKSASQFVIRNITENKKIEKALQIANEELKERVHELQERNEEIILLSYMSDLLQACINLDEAYTVISQILPLLFPSSSGRIFRLTESKNLLESVAVWGDSEVSQSLFSPHDCMALRRGQPHLVEDKSRGLLCNHILTPWPAATFCIPMVAQGQATGILHFSFSEKGLLSKPKQQLAITVSRQISLALANLKLYETLQHQSIRDPLTGLFNRRYLEESLKREVHRSERNHQNLGIIMIDVDHFKQFNDSFGHDAGDTVLRELGLFIKGQIRESDIACRYGGEELILILPEATLEVTKIRAETIREGVKYLNLQHRREAIGAITISVGVACFPEHGLTSEAIIRAADVALYRAKKQGRDQVSVASTPS